MADMTPKKKLKFIAKQIHQPLDAAFYEGNLICCEKGETIIYVKPQSQSVVRGNQQCPIITHFFLNFIK